MRSFPHLQSQASGCLHLSSPREDPPPAAWWIELLPTPSGRALIDLVPSRSAHWGVGSTAKARHILPLLECANSGDESSAPTYLHFPRWHDTPASHHCRPVKKRSSRLDVLLVCILNVNGFFLLAFRPFPPLRLSHFVLYFRLFSSL